MTGPSNSIEVYRLYVAQALCWVDGVPTHNSSDRQRQCPKCRRKWSYDRLGTELDLLEAYCHGTSATQAARDVRCAKNTALGHFNHFTRKMEETVAKMLLEERIATNPISLREVKSLEKALRAGSYRRREKACRHLFLSALKFEERIEIIFRETIARAVLLRIRRATGEEPERLVFASSRFGRPHRRKAKEPWSLGMLRAFLVRTWQRLRSRFDPNYDQPSRGCARQGDLWVKVWRVARERTRNRG